MRSEYWGFGDEEELEDDEDYDEDDDEIAASFSIIMGVAFPERLPELFDHDEDEIIPVSKEDPELEAKLFLMLPQAVAVIQEYANAVRDGMNSMRPDNYPAAPKPIKAEKIGRNDPCPCGSGKKYKKCCGQ